MLYRKTIKSIQVEIKFQNIYKHSMVFTAAVSHDHNLDEIIPTLQISHSFGSSS